MKATAMLRHATFLALTALLVAASGCATWCGGEVKRATDTAVVDANPSAANKGYVEFYTLATNFPVPIYILDDRGKPIQLASVGLKRGDYFSVARNGPVAAEKLRVALPAGNHVFMVENNGQILQVPVKASEVTQVEIDYAVVDYAAQNLVYRLDTRIFKPAPKQASNNSAPGPLALKTD